MKHPLRLLLAVVALSMGLALVPGVGPEAHAAKKAAKKKGSPSTKDDADEGAKSGASASSRKGDKAAAKKGGAAKSEERKGPAAFGAVGQDVNRDAMADKKRDEAIEQLKKIIPKVPDGSPQKADLLFQLAELWYEKSKYVYFKEMRAFDEEYAKYQSKINKGEKAKEPKISNRESELYRAEAMRLYETILREYPTYNRKDEVLFTYAYNQYELGKKEAAVQKYWDLIKQYPSSKFVPDAYVQMGEHFFANNQLGNARKAYEKALESKTPKIYAFALYKLAWCDFNAGDFEGAIKRFKDVITFSETKGREGMGLKNEALNDIVLSFTRVGGVDEPIAYFKEHAGKARARDLSRKLAGQLGEAGKHEDAIKTYRILIDEEPNDPRSPEYQSAIVHGFEQLRKRDMVAKEMRRLVEQYRPTSPWAKANASNKGALRDAFDRTETAMREMVTEYHQEAQRTKSVETYRLARDIYKEYLDNFAGKEYAELLGEQSEELKMNSYNLRYYYAEILWTLEEWEKAAEQYEKVVEVDAKGQYSKHAAYNTILAYEKLVAISRGTLKQEELRANQKVDERKDKGEIKKEKIALKSAKKDQVEEAIPKWEGRLTSACDRFVTLYPNNEDEIAVKYKAAFVYYDHHHTIEWTKRFGEIILKWPEDDNAVKAADLTLDALNTKEEWLDLNKLSRQFHANKRLAKPGSDFEKRVAKLVEGSQYKYVDETLYRKEKRTAEAAEAFRKFVREFPKSDYSPQALLYSMIIYSEANELDKGIDVGEQMLKQFPESKFVPRTLLYLGSFYDKTADFANSARYYDMYVERHEKLLKDKKPDPELKKEMGEKVADALYNAALWNEGLGRYDVAVARYLKYVKEFKDKKDVPELYFNVGLIYEKQKSFKDAAKVFDSYVAQYAKGLPAGKVYYARFRQMQALREEGKEAKDAKETKLVEKEIQKLREELLKGFAKLSPEEKREDLALNAYAQLRFEEMEPVWREYLNIRFDNVKELRKRLAEKLKKITSVEKGYTEVVALGSGEWGIAALTRIGQAYQDFARNFIDSPDPKGLDEDQKQMYREELENKAFPLEEKAIEAFEKSLAKSFELSIYNEWTTLAEDQINKYKPGAFGEAKVVPFQGGEFFNIAPVILTASARVAPAAGQEKP